MHYEYPNKIKFERAKAEAGNDDFHAIYVRLGGKVVEVEDKVKADAEPVEAEVAEKPKKAKKK